jgi:mannan endo-1,6-alpha-mannosidase
MIGSLFSTVLPVLAAGLHLAGAISLISNDEGLFVRILRLAQADWIGSGSVMSAAATLAHGLMSSYKNNATDTAFKDVGTFPYPPYYWWESGAIWGGMVNYWAYTGDTSYVETTTQALMAQAMPTMDFMAPDWYFSLGNDDQAFWAIACLNAAEYNFPVPAGNASTVWLDLAEGVFNSQVARWDMSTCNGGLRWQIFPQNKGYDYKNSISNGCVSGCAVHNLRHTMSN